MHTGYGVALPMFIFRGEIALEHNGLEYGTVLKALPYIVNFVRYFRRILEFCTGF